jgi:DNA-binding NarL/FixJ family response regulator
MRTNTPSTSNLRIRVLLIAKYPIVQQSLKFLLESNKDLKVSGTHSFDTDVAKSIHLPNSDVVVVYISEGDRVEIISDILRSAPKVRVVVLTAGADLDAQADALKLGAVGIVQKEQSPKLLIEAIRQTHSGETWLNQVLLTKLLARGKSGTKRTSKEFRCAAETLTTRELEVVQLIGEGLKNKAIAARLFISEATIRHHLSSIYGKVGVDDRLNLVIFAYEEGLIGISDAPGKTVH